MSAFTPADWSDFFVAEVGAAAALTGLVIVAISINLATILKSPLLTGRAGETLVLLAGILLLATLALVPGQPIWVVGAECLAVGLSMAGAGGLALYRARNHYHPDEARWLRFVFNFGAPLPIAGAGLSLLTGAGGGLYWLVPGVVISLIGGVLNSWILLIEILR
jgi:modulator of FtsH protease